MVSKIGSVYRINNRQIEIVHNRDIFSSPKSDGKGLHIVGLMNSYVSIPLFNASTAIGIIFEQIEPSKENEILFSPKSEIVISKIRLIGIYDSIKEDFKKGIDFFPTLNSDVFSIDSKMLSAIYGTVLKKSNVQLQIGTDIYLDNVIINADPNILFGKHCAVFGNTGSGKSCTIASVLQGVYLDRKSRLNNTTKKRLKTIIIDSNEEYAKVFDDAASLTDGNTITPDWVSVQSFEDLELSHKDLNFHELTELLKEDSLNVIPYLRQAICTLKNTDNVDDKTYYEFATLAEQVVKEVPKIKDIKGNVMDDVFTMGYLKHVVRRIKNFSEDDRLTSIFGKEHNSIMNFLSDSKKSVLILSLRVSNDILSLLSYMICKSIFSFKSNVGIDHKENILLVLEEAHRYISSNSTGMINNYYVDKLAREGRKYGVNLLVSTQRPSEVSQTVISQCNSLIVHKISNARDLEFIRNTIEYDDKNQIDLLTSLKQQQALVLGEAFAFSSLVRIADANPLPRSETPTIFTADLDTT